MTADWTAVPGIGWTLLHFLWQGTLVALALAGVLLLVPQGWARVRYGASCAALVVMAIAPVVTAAALLSGGTAGIDPSSALGTAPALSFLGGASASAGRIETSATGQATGVETWLTWLVIAWVVGVLASATRLLGGWWHARRLLTRDAMTAEASWTDVVDRLARQLQIRQPVRLLQSARAHVPLVIGSVRPVLLLPAAALSGLTPQQVEAILAHELAHIRRHDYVVNLLQSAIETVLFYHPAVWWVSHTIRVEREHCCDDLAVRTCGDPLLYARALTALETVRGARFGMAMAASSGSLLSRVRRVLGQRPPAPVASSGWVVTSVTVLMVAGAGAGGWMVDPGRWMTHVASTAQAIALPSPETDEGTLSGDAAAQKPGRADQRQAAPGAASSGQTPEPPSSPRGEATEPAPSDAPEPPAHADLKETIDAAVGDAMAALETALSRLHDDPAVAATIEQSVRGAERALREAEPAMAAVTSAAVREAMRDAERSLREAQPAISAATSESVREAMREAQRSLREAQPEIAMAAATSEAVRKALREASRHVQVLEEELRHELQASQERRSSKADETRSRADARRKAVTARQLQRRARALAADAARFSAEASRLHGANGQSLPPERVKALQDLARQLEEQARALASEAPQPRPAPRPRPQPRRSPKHVPAVPAPPHAPAPPAAPDVEPPVPPPAPDPPPQRSRADLPSLPPVPAQAPAPVGAPVPATPATQEAPPTPPLP